MATELRQPEVRSGPKASREQTEKSGCLSVQCDEIWSFVGSKGRKKWIWLALDTETREIVGVFVGSRGKLSAKGLWSSLPAVYRQCAILYTDFWKTYAEVFPSRRHKAVGKSSGKTNYIERFNCTLRQRVSRLVRSTLSFFKSWRIMSALFGPLCITTTRLYPFRNTVRLCKAITYLRLISCD